MINIDVLSYIFSYLEPKSLPRVRMVCRSWKEAAIIIENQWFFKLKELSQSALSEKSYVEFQRKRTYILKHLFTPNSQDSFIQSQYMAILHDLPLYPTTLQKYLSEIPKIGDLIISESLLDAEKTQPRNVHFSDIQKSAVLRGEIDVTTRCFVLSLIEVQLDIMSLFNRFLQDSTFEEVEAMIALGADVNSVTRCQIEGYLGHRKTSLSHAQLNNTEKTMDIVRAVLQAGANPNSKNLNPKPLNLAAKHNACDLAKLLLAYEADPNGSSLFSSPHLVDVGAPNLKPPLFHVKSLQVQTAKLLLDYGANPLLSHDGQTAYNAAKANKRNDLMGLYDNWLSKNKLNP